MNINSFFSSDDDNLEKSGSLSSLCVEKNLYFHEIEKRFCAEKDGRAYN